jgi:chromosome segregation protein
MSAAPHHLRAVEPASPAEPAPSRARLQAALGALAAAEAFIERISAARARLHGKHVAVIGRISVARAALHEAQADRQRNRVARLLGNAAEAPSMAELEHGIAAAELERDAVLADERLLDEELAGARATLASRRADLTAAIAEAMRPTAEGMVARIAELHQEIENLKAACERFPPGTLPAGWNANRQYRADLQLALRVADTAATLAADAHAIFPKELT